MIVTRNSCGEGRDALRRRLLAARDRFVASPAAAEAAEALAAHLGRVLEALEAERLGVYWPVRSEFNAAAALSADRKARLSLMAIPFARRSPPAMEYRRWDGAEPTSVDEMGIPTSTGAVVQPDVVLVPCVGFTPDGYRLGYGGGFFDRWLAGRPAVTAVGIAWALAEMAAGDFEPAPHDRPLTLVVTENGVVS